VVEEIRDKPVANKRDLEKSMADYYTRNSKNESKVAEAGKDRDQNSSKNGRKPKKSLQKGATER
jgi:hypothetical protein